MGFITSLFGESSGQILTVLFALGIVLVLIVLAVWLLKLVYSASGKVARGRNRRLGVMETLAIDQKRQLLVIRRDNVEHLILIGGPHDLVIETGIPLAEPAAAPTGRRPVPMVPVVSPAKPRPVVAAAPAPAPTPDVQPDATALDRLRHMGQPAKAKSAKSLRHTGLMRPGEQAGAAGNAGNSDNEPASATDPATDEATQSVVDDANRDDHKDANRT